MYLSKYLFWILPANMRSFGTEQDRNNFDMSLNHPGKESIPEDCKIDGLSQRQRDLASRLRLTPNGKRQAAICSKMHKLVFLVLTSLFFAFAR